MIFTMKFKSGYNKYTLQLTYISIILLLIIIELIVY